MPKKFWLPISIIAISLTIMAGFAYADDGDPVNSGFVISFSPRAHILNIEEEITWEDKITTRTGGSETLEMDETDFDVNESLGVYFNLTYITPAYLYFGFEFGHQVFLGAIEGELKSTESDGSLLDSGLGDTGEETRHEYNIRSTQVGGFAGLYLHKAPVRPFLQVNAGAAFEELTFLGEDYEAEGIPFYAAASAGIDFFPSEHLMVGAGARVDQFFGETFSKDFTEDDGNDHEFSTDSTRMPLSTFVRIGYVF